MIKKTTIYVFVVLYLVAMLRPITPIIEYVVNYDYISEVLCVNKDKPEMSCNGKCYVMQKFEKQKTEDFKSLTISTEDYPIGFVEIFRLENFPKFSKKHSEPYFYQLNYSFQFIEPKEHPPQLV